MEIVISFNFERVNASKADTNENVTIRDLHLNNIQTI